MVLKVWEEEELDEPQKRVQPWSPQRLYTEPLKSSCRADTPNRLLLLLHTREGNVEAQEL